MKTIETSILIDATPQKVWEVLTDFENYSKWNPFIQSIHGQKEKGGRLEVSIQPPEGNKLSFEPVVLEWCKHKMIRWKRELYITGLFDGEHYFIIEPYKSYGTNFIQGENFSGLLVPLLRKSLYKTEKGFYMMNADLKEYCEQEKTS